MNTNTPAPGTEHQASFTVTKQIRQTNPTNWQTFSALHALLHDLEACANGCDTTVLPNTLRLEARPNINGTEISLYAFAKPTERKLIHNSENKRG